MIDEIATYIIAILPSLITVISVVAMVLKLVKNFNTLKEEVTNSNRMKKIEDSVQAIVQENYELRKQIKQLIQKMDKVKIKENKEE